MQSSSDAKSNNTDTDGFRFKSSIVYVKAPGLDRLRPSSVLPAPSMPRKLGAYTPVVAGASASKAEPVASTDEPGAPTLAADCESDPAGAATRLAGTASPSDAVVLRRLQIAGLPETTANLCNTTLGAGILSFPVAYARGGLLGSSAFILLMAVVGLLSSLATARIAAQTGALTLAAASRHTVGPRCELFVNVMVRTWQRLSPTAISHRTQSEV